MEPDFKIILLTLLLVFCEVNFVFAQGKIYQLGSDNNYAAAVRDDQFKYYPALNAKQEEDNWCWAACIQMVLHYQGLYVDQCEIVKKALGMSSCINKPADCYTIENGADGWFVNGERVKAIVDFSPSVFELIDQLAYRNPVIIGLNMPGQNVGHAYVLTAVFFRRDFENHKIPYRVVLRDPWPDNNSRQEFEWSDFVNRINCITYVTIN